MALQFEIVGFSFFMNDNPAGRAFKKLAKFDVKVPELGGATIFNCLLTWGPAKGWIAMPPTVPLGKAPHVKWFHGSEFARRLCDEMVIKYFAMGGEDPRPIDMRDPIAQAKAGGIERRVYPATFTIVETEPAANDNEAVESPSVEAIEAARAIG